MYPPFKSKSHWLLLCAFACLLLNPLALKAQTNEDILLITEARVAIEKHYDYKTALSSLSQVSQAGQGLDLYYLYMAKANEGLGNYSDALTNYQSYVDKTHLTPEMAEKIADLRYKVRSDKNRLDERRTKRHDDLTGRYRITDDDKDGNFAGNIKFKQEDTRITVYNASDEILFEGRRYSGSDQFTGTWHYVYHGSENCDESKADLTIDVKVTNGGEGIEFSIPYIGCRVKKGEVTLGILSALSGKQREMQFELYEDKSLMLTKTYERK